MMSIPINRIAVDKSHTSLVWLEDPERGYQQHFGALSALERPRNSHLVPSMAGANLIASHHIERKCGTLLSNAVFSILRTLYKSKILKSYFVRISVVKAASPSY